MPLTRSKGNMYDWVSHKHTHIGGECPHKCVYCSVRAIKWEVARKRYSGPCRLINKEFEVNYGSGKTIFIEHLNDLFAYGVPNHFVQLILDHCHQWPDNTYVFQTKNPARYIPWRSQLEKLKCMLGTTIETNRCTMALSQAYPPQDRANAIAAIGHHFKTFITVEPIVEFDTAEFVKMIVDARPQFVNVGADSKGHKLPEPDWEQIREFSEQLEAKGIEVRGKPELHRIRRATMSAVDLAALDGECEA